MITDQEFADLLKRQDQEWQEFLKHWKPIEIETANLVRAELIGLERIP